MDPDGTQWETIGPERALGCVVYAAGEIVEPGVVEISGHLSQKRLPLGEPDGARSARALALSRAFIAAGFKAPVRERHPLGHLGQALGLTSPSTR